MVQITPIDPAVTLTGQWQDLALDRNAGLFYGRVDFSAMRAGDVIELELRGKYALAETATSLIKKWTLRDQQDEDNPVMSLAGEVELYTFQMRCRQTAGTPRTIKRYFAREAIY